MVTKSLGGGDETTSSKKHAMEQSPRKATPSKKPKVEQMNQGIFKIHTGDKLDNTLANLETRIAKAENGSQKRIGALRKKLADEHANLCSMIDKKLDQDAAMTDEEHEKFITEIAEMATRAHLRKVLKNKVKAIVKDIIEDVVEDVVEDVIDDIVNEKLAAIYRTQQQQARQLAAIMNWVRDI